MSSEDSRRSTSGVAPSCIVVRPGIHEGPQTLRRPKSSRLVPVGENCWKGAEHIGGTIGFNHWIRRSSHRASFRPKMRRSPRWRRSTRRLRRQRAADPLGKPENYGCDGSSHCAVSGSYSRCMIHVCQVNTDKGCECPTELGSSGNAGATWV